ncbi:SBBP repeat-containing protein [Chloroflexota bacterium]
MRTVSRLFILIIVLCSLHFEVLPARASVDSDTGENLLQQFTSGSHILGFGKREMCLAGLDHALRVEFVGGRTVKPVAEGTRNEQNGIAPLGKVSYKGVWDQIDAIYSAVESGIAESTYVVHPGGSPSDISLRYNVPLEITPDGGLRFNFESGYLTESAPVAWQEINGQHIPINVHFTQQGETQAGFALVDYNTQYPVYIDPTYEWHTVYGEYDGDDIAFGIAIDSSSNVYVAGSSEYTWDGPGGIEPLNAFTDDYDMAIVKLNSAGAYQWHTFYGSASYDEAYSISLDSNSNVYVAGYSDADWGAAPVNGYTGGSDITVIKLDSAGGYQWHAFYGSASDDVAFGIAVVSSSNIYVAGYSDADWGAPVDGYTGNSDITIIKLNSNGGYGWHTFHGSASIDKAYGIALDSSANVYVVGYSLATWNGPIGQVPRNAHTGNWDWAIVKLNRTGGYQWHTFYGSAIGDTAFGIALDPGSNIYVAGSSGATWNGPGGQPPLNAQAGNRDMAIVKLNSNGNYQWHTFYGSAALDWGAYGIALDSGSNVYITGESTAWNGPGGQPPLNAHAGDDDIPIIKLDSNGNYQWHTFYGSADEEYAECIALDSSSNIYVAGYSEYTWNCPGASALGYDCDDYYYMMVIVKTQDDEPTITSGAAPAPAASRVSPTPPRPLNPAQLSMLYLSVNPQQTSAGQPVTITTNVVNTGDEAGNYNVVLKINGQVEQTRMVGVGPQGTQPVKFTVAKSQPGTYTVDIAGQKGSFTIIGAGSNTGTHQNGGLIAIFIVGILVIVISALLILDFHRRTY